MSINVDKLNKSILRSQLIDRLEKLGDVTLVGSFAYKNNSVHEGSDMDIMMRYTSTNLRDSAYNLGFIPYRDWLINQEGFRRDDGAQAGYGDVNLYHTEADLNLILKTPQEYAIWLMALELTNAIEGGRNEFICFRDELARRIGKE